MQITLTVPDQKADAFLDVLQHISYVEIQPSVLDAEPSDDGELTEEEFYEDLREAIHELNEVLAGRKQAQSAKEFLAELRGQNVG